MNKISQNCEYDKMQKIKDQEAVEWFKRRPYQSVDVAEYLAKKYDIKKGADTVG